MTLLLADAKAVLRELQADLAAKKAEVESRGLRYLCTCVLQPTCTRGSAAKAGRACGCSFHEGEVATRC